MQLTSSYIIEILNVTQYGLPIFLLLGLTFGSFATMASYRIPRGEGLVIKPSKCPKCGHRLGVWDLFPILSWVFTCGQCRHCKVKISLRYPLTEIAMGSLFCLIYYKFGFGLESLALLGLMVCLVILIITDLEHRIIPDSIQIAILLVGILYRFAKNSEIIEYFSTPIFGLALALALRYGFWLWKKKEGLGMGDVKFFTVAGMFLSIKSFMPFLFLSGTLGIIFAYFWKKLGGEEEFPFGPALAASMILCIVFPEYFVDLFYYHN